MVGIGDRGEPLFLGDAGELGILACSFSFSAVSMNSALICSKPSFFAMLEKNQ